MNERAERLMAYAARAVKVVSALMLVRFVLLREHIADALNDSPVMWLGVMFFLLAAASMFKMQLARGAYVITSGVYAMVAHPMYAAYVVMDAAASWRLAVWDTQVVATAAAFYGFMLIAAYIEEAMLIELFGKEAAAYYRRTPSIHFLLLRIRGTESG